MNLKYTHVYKFDIEWNNVTKVRKYRNLMNLMNRKHTQAYKFNIE
jgi:hypothetical protein